MPCVPFVKSKEVIELCAMVNTYKVLPSALFAIEDPYTAFCFNEAIALIIQHLENGDEPIFRVGYKKPSDLYKKYGR